MNQNLFFNSLLQIFTFAIVGLVILWVSYQAIKHFIGKKLVENPSYEILTCGILFSIGSIIISLTHSIQNAVKLLKNLSWLESIKFVILFLLISVFITGIIITITWFVYKYINKNINKCKQKSISVAFITITIVIVVAFITKEGFVNLLESLIPYPRIPNYF